MKIYSKKIGSFNVKVRLYSNITRLETTFITGVFMFGERLDSAIRYGHFFDHLERTMPKKGNHYGGSQGFINERFVMGLHSRRFHTVEIDRIDQDLPSFDSICTEHEEMTVLHLTNWLENNFDDLKIVS